MKVPPLKDDCFALPPGVDWAPVDQALAHLRDNLSAVTPVIQQPSSAACGSILARDVTAARSNPPAANSAVDGYGFAFDELPEREIIELPLASGRSAAGQPYTGQLPPGQALRILTGAIVPDGVDTIVLEEDCTNDAGMLAFRKGVKRGANLRKAGEDVKQGEIILPAGRRLSPADLALLAAVGVDQVAVYAPLRVAVLSTGDEVIASGQPAGDFQIFDANRPMVLALLERWGHQPVDLGHAADDPKALRAALDTGAAEADVILTSGGASAGDEDHVSALLKAEGQMHLWRIAVKPGRPLALAQWKGVPVFGLPGNPVAAWVCTLIFARPALECLAGGAFLEAQGYLVPAAFGKSKKPGRREYLRARMNSEGKVEAFPSEGSGRISGLSWSGGLVELPDQAVKIKPGDPVRFIPYGSFGI